MAGQLTHLVLSEMIYQKVDIQVQNHIDFNKNLYYLGTQGPDVFFYNVAGLIINSKLRNLSNTFHEKNVNQLLTELLKNCKKNKNLLPFYYGYLTHYVVDYHIHPYIYYRVSFDKTNYSLKTVKSTLQHRYLEKVIDTVIYEMTSIKETPILKKTSIYDLYIVNENDLKNIITLTQKVALDVYKLKLNFSDINDNYKVFYKYMKANKNKLNYNLPYKFSENISLKYELEHLNNILPKKILEHDIDIFNIKKEDWTLPYTEDVVVNLSLFELLENSANECTRLINLSNDYVNGKIPIYDVSKELKGYSMLTGSEIVIKKKLITHDNIFNNKKFKGLI